MRDARKAGGSAFNENPRGGVSLGREGGGG